MPVVPFIPAIMAVASKVGTQKLSDPLHILPKGAAKVLNKVNDPLGIFMKPDAAGAGTGLTSGPTVMPVADGAAVQAAKRKSIIEQINSRGRASTLLSDPSNEKLGG